MTATKPISRLGVDGALRNQLSALFMAHDGFVAQITLGIHCLNPAW